MPALVFLISLLIFYGFAARILKYLYDTFHSEVDIVNFQQASRSAITESLKRHKTLEGTAGVTIKINNEDLLRAYTLSQGMVFRALIWSTTFCTKRMKDIPRAKMIEANLWSEVIKSEVFNRRLSSYLFQKGYVEQDHGQKDKTDVTVTSKGLDFAQEGWLERHQIAFGAIIAAVVGTLPTVIEKKWSFFADIIKSITDLFWIN